MDLRRRFLDHVEARGLLSGGERVLVACSGGVDSTVLLHLLRFRNDLSLRISAAHFDHRMRPGSAGDARWVRGLARAWEVPLVAGEAEAAPEGEDQARRARYAFLREARRATGSRRLLTAHHADDQAETVLFRVLRGTGIAGLGGIPERGPDGILRPLLPFRRGELLAYAERHRVPYLTDPTNRDPRFARNVLRHEILPRVEEAVAPGATPALLRLARLAAREEEAWGSLLPGLLEGVLVETGEGGIVISRTSLLAFHPALRARLLREVLRRLGVVLDEAGTRAALEFTSSGASGRRHDLPGGLILAREFDHVVLSRRGKDEDELLDIVEPGEGEGRLTLAGRTHRIEWTRSGTPVGRWVEAFAGRLTFPLRFRGWSPGDRIRMPYGSKKLKKLFAEARVPAGERWRRPVLVDGEGSVLWVPGLARSEKAGAPGAEQGLIIGVTEADTG